MVEEQYEEIIKDVMIKDAPVVTQDQGYETRSHARAEVQCEEWTISVDVGGYSGDDDQDILDMIWMPATIKAFVVSCSHKIN